MQNKNNKNQSKTTIRHMHERIGAAALILGTVIGTAGVSHDARKVLSQLAMRPAYAVVEHSGKENETARMPVRLDSVLRGQTVGGE